MNAIDTTTQIGTAIVTYFSGTWGQIELVATAMLVINVYLLAREKISNYVFGAFGVALYGLIFWNAKLYSDMLLQWVYYLPLQVLGFYWWKYGGVDKTELRIRTMNPLEWCATIGSTLIIWGAMGLYMKEYTDASFPILDSLIVAMSVVANFLLIKKILENWIMWISLDFLAIYVYFQKGLYVTTGLYVMFLCLATYGLINWLSEYRKPVTFGRGNQ